MRASRQGWPELRARGMGLSIEQVGRVVGGREVLSRQGTEKFVTASTTRLFIEAF